MNCTTCVYYKVCARLGGITENGCADYCYKSLSAVDVTLPGPLGSTIYFINKRTGEIDTDTIKFFTLTGSGIKPILNRHNTKFWEIYSWGKDVFMSRAEAELALSVFRR